MAEKHVLAQLMATIEDRKRTMPEGSYTATLFEGGMAKIVAKIHEETAELVEATGEPGEPGQRHLVREAADLLYHLLVLLAAQGVSYADVEAELARRFGVSGLAEKAARPRTGSAGNLGA